MRAGRLGDFVRLLVLLVLTVRGGAATALPFVRKIRGLGERQDGAVPLRTYVGHFDASREIDVVVGLQGLCADAHAAQTAFRHAVPP